VRRPLRTVLISATAVLGLTVCIPFAAMGGVLGGVGNTGTPAAGTSSPAAARALTWALARVGTPYRWGGSGPDGFDCSGLVQAAYAVAGIGLPRVAQAQFDAGPPATGGLVPGDLVFFGAGAHGVDHVGIALGDGLMVDAPHTGADVRVEAIWSDSFVGATRPAP
jgi:cell wall-associated NlpC family hydrolase